MKKLALIICLALLLSISLSSCGKSMEERAASIVVGMTYGDAVTLMGEKGELTDPEEDLYTWDCGNGKTLCVWLKMPVYDDHSDHTGHNHSYDYPNSFMISKIEMRNS